MKNWKTRLLPLALGVLLAALCLPQTALAYDPIPDLDRLCSLTVESQHAGVTYEAYQVCEVSSGVRFTPCGEFADATISGTVAALVELGDWTGLTSSLNTWLTGREADGSPVTPQGVGTTGPDCTAVIEDLPTGLYLVRGRAYLTDEGYYIPVSFMICLPNWVQAGDPGNGTGADAWVYDVVTANKGSLIDRDLTARNALKVWRGDGSAARPTEVTVQLLRTDRATGETIVYDEARLNGLNGWHALWSELDNVNYSWTVREVNVAADYDVEYRQDGINVVITNYYSPDGPPKGDPDPDPENPSPSGNPDDPDNPDDPSPDNPTLYEQPNIPSEEDIDDPSTPLTRPPLEETREPDDEEDLDDPDVPLARLPQTGVLWWPVPFLAIGGMFLFLLGWVLNRRSRDEEEE